MFLYKVKYLPNGDIDKFKVRLVVLGNIQKNKGQYTYAPVLNEVSFKILLTYGIKHKMYCHQLDVCTAYLHAEIQEDVYIQLPKDTPIYGNSIFKLKKSLYGLRSSALQWYKTMSSILQEIGFNKSMSDSCIFIYKNKVRTTNERNEFAILGLYVDDIILLTNELELMHKLKNSLNERITLSDKEDIRYFLNLEISYDRDGGLLSICQQDYIIQSLKEFNLQDANGKYTLVSPGTDVYSSHGELLEERTCYLSMLGRLIYLSVHSRRDITFIVNRLCQHMQQPTKSHLELVKRVFRYLKYTIKYQLYFKPIDKNIAVYCDADYANDSTSKSINGMFTLLFGCIVEWSSRKQMHVSTSTCQAELVSIADGVSSLIYLKSLLADFDSCEYTYTVFNDNTGAISTCLNGGDFAKNKQYRIKINYIMERIREGWLNINHVSTDRMIADFLTKPLAQNKLNSLLKLINLY